jgi:hypothetical protein
VLRITYAVVTAPSELLLEDSDLKARNFLVRGILNDKGEHSGLEVQARSFGLSEMEDCLQHGAYETEHRKTASLRFEAMMGMVDVSAHGRLLREFVTNPHGDLAVMADRLRGFENVPSDEVSALLDQEGFVPLESEITPGGRG